MSMFVCAECGGLRDSDYGCEEAPASKYFPAHQLLCVDCLDDEPDEEEATPTSTKDTTNA